MRLQLVSARDGALWVREGLQTFAEQRLVFIALFFFFMMLISAASQLPFVGAALALMLVPTMTLAIMAATAHAADPERPAPGTVFIAAFQAVRAATRPLAVLGVLYAALFLAVMALSALADGGQFARIYLLGEPLTREIAETSEFQSALWITMGLYLPLSLAFWHAPALVHWGRVPPARSLFFSFVACARNFGALAVFGVVWVGVFIGGGISLGLIATLVFSVLGEGAAESGGAVMVSGALIMAAMFFASTWFTFRDSFEDS